MIHIDVNIDTSDLEAAISRLRERRRTPRRSCAGALTYWRGAAEGAFDDEADPVTARSGTACGFNGGGPYRRRAFRQDIAVYRKPRLFA